MSALTSEHETQALEPAREAMSIAYSLQRGTRLQQYRFAVLAFLRCDRQVASLAAMSEQQRWCNTRRALAVGQKEPGARPASELRDEAPGLGRHPAHALSGVLRGRVVTAQAGIEGIALTGAEAAEARRNRAAFERHAAVAVRGRRGRRGRRAAIRAR